MKKSAKKKVKSPKEKSARFPLHMEYGQHEGCSFSDFKDWMKENIPSKVKNITMRVENEYGEYAEDGIETSCIVFTWKIK
jgi:hypothetical protein